MNRRSVAGFGALLVAVTSAIASEQAIVPEAIALGRPVSFQQDVLPMFENNCLACHHSGAAEGGLILEDAAGLLKGGKRGAAIVAREPDKSLLYLVASRAAQPVMPPLPNKASAVALTPKEVGTLRKWIEEGAVIDDAASTTWAFRPISPDYQAVYGVALTPWARHAVASRGQHVDVYDLARGAFEQRLVDPQVAMVTVEGQALYRDGAAHLDFVTAVASSPVESRIATGAYREIKVWRKASPRQAAVAKLPEASPVVVISADTRFGFVARPTHVVAQVDLGSGQVVREFSGHTADVTAMAVSADGTRLWTTSRDKTLRVWDTTTGQSARWLHLASEGLALVLTEDGQRLAIAQADAHVRVWDPAAILATTPADGAAADVAPLGEIRSDTPGIVLLRRVSGQVRHIAGACKDGTCRIWDLEAKSLVRQYWVGATATDIALSPNGQWVATVAGQLLKLYRTDAQLVKDLRDDLASQRALWMAEDSQQRHRSRLNVAEEALRQAEKAVTDREEGKKKAAESLEAAKKALAEAEPKVQMAQQAVEAAVKELEANAADEALKKKKTEADTKLKAEQDAFNTLKLKFESAERGIPNAETQAQWAAERKVAALTRQNAEKEAFQLAEAATNQAKQTPLQIAHNVLAVAFSADSQWLFTLGEDGRIRQWNAANGETVDTWPAHTGAGVGLLTVADGRVWSWGADATLQGWDVTSGWMLERVLGPGPAGLTDLSNSPMIDRVSSLAFSPNGTLLASGGGDPSRGGEMLLWDLATGQLVKTFHEAHSDVVGGLEFSHNGQQLASCAADKFVKVHDVATGQLVRSFEGHTGYVQDVSWRADGAMLASCGADNVIKIWNMETGEQHRTIQNHSKPVNSIQFIGVSDNVITASGDLTVKLHRAGDGGHYRSCGGSVDYQNAVAASRDERVVISGGADGILRLWNGQNGQQVFEFKAPPAPAPQTVLR